MIIIKNLDPNKIKIDEKPYKNILIYYIGYVVMKSVKVLYLIINKINGYIEESNGTKCLTLVSAYENKDTLKRYEELWSKIRDLIISITNCLHNSNLNNSVNNDEKYMKIKLNLDDHFLLKKTLEL